MNVLVRGIVNKVFNPREGAKSFTFTVGAGVSMTSFGSLKQQLMGNVREGDLVQASGSTSIYTRQDGSDSHSVILNGDVTLATPEDGQEIESLVAFSGIGSVEDIDIRRGNQGDYAFVTLTEKYLSYRGEETDTYKLAVFDGPVLQQLRNVREGDKVIVRGKIERTKSGKNWYTTYRLASISSVALREPAPAQPEYQPPYQDGQPAQAPQQTAPQPQAPQQNNQQVSAPQQQAPQEQETQQSTSWEDEMPF